MNNRPIGIFDSGVGGLTVLTEYLKELPNENYIYFGDTARLPYGSKSQDTIINFSKQITDFLISKDVKMIVIACGTASAMAYSELKKSYDIPIIDIISPTAEEIKDTSIGVIATKGTIKSKAWENAIRKYSPNTKILSQACPLFVPIVEEGFANSEISEIAIKQYLSVFKASDISSLILGCTHYPILSKQIQKELGENVQLVNAGTYSALYAKDFLIQNNLLSDNNGGSIDFYSSDDEKYFKEIAKTFFPAIEKYKVKKYSFK